MNPASAHFVIVRLKPGWRFEPDRGRVVRRGRSVRPSLPPGARLQPALPLADTAAPPGAAERELGRWMRLPASDALPAALALALVRSWDFVEHAEIVLNG
jgi:hypothetical protein